MRAIEFLRQRKEVYFSQFAEPMDDEPNHKRFFGNTLPKSPSSSKNCPLYTPICENYEMFFELLCLARHQLIVINIVSKLSYNVEVLVL